jgi:Uma2 family endonuclease
MNDQTPIRMTVDEFLSWVPAQDGRWELIDRRPVRMRSETFDHIDVKALVWLALKEHVADFGLELQVLSDGRRSV